MKKLISLILFFFVLSSICLAQKKPVSKIKKPIHMKLPPPPEIKYADSTERKQTRGQNSPEPIDQPATIAVDSNPIKGGKHSNGFNKYANNSVFTPDDILLEDLTSAVDEKSKASKNALIIYYGNGTVASIDPNKQTINWVYAEKGIKSSNNNKFTVENGTIYVPYQNGTVTALDINTGEVKWKDKIGLDPQKTMLSGQVAPIDKGLLFIAARNKNVYAINKINGKLLWNYRLDYEYNLYPPLVSNDAVFFNNAPYVYKFDSQTGKAIWQRGFIKAMYAKMVTDEKRVYAANESSTLTAIDPQGSSTVDWEFNLSDNQYGIDENIILNNNVIYLAGKANPDSKSSSVYAVNKTNGQQIWKTDLPKNRIENLILSADRIYGYMKDQFFVIGANDGKLEFSIKPSEVPISNLIRESDKSILYVSKNGLVRYSIADKHFKLMPFPDPKTDTTGDDKTTIALVLSGHNAM